MKTKICSKCKQEKPISEFSHRKDQYDGYDYYCKNCKQIINNKSSKKMKCLDCDKMIWIGSIRCKHHARIHQYKINPDSNNMKGKIGKNHPSWKGGWKHFCIDCGKKIDFDAIRCKKHARIFQYKNPENHPQWIDGRSYEPYPLEFNDKLKQSIRKRDNYTCQNCGMTEEEHLIVVGQSLHVHHIDYNKDNCKETNLITTCMSCNIRANFNRDYWQEFYINKIAQKTI